MDADLTNWRNVLFSIASGPLSDSEKEQLARVQCYWVHLNTRLGRFFIDIIGPVNRLQNIQDKLTELGRDPIVIGIFDGDGVLQGNANNAEWLKVAQDVRTYDALGNLISSLRPVAFVDTHRWAGWGPKNP
jgi:hypothetical protein